MSKCPSCKVGNLKENPEWDKAYDQIDRNQPAHDLVVRELNRRGIEQYYCDSCDYKRFA